jgi:hypothetical protein
MITHHAKNDFNGDGRSDILWLSDYGQTTVWLSGQIGGFTTTSSFNQNISGNYEILATGDFDGNGRSDEAITGAPILGSVLPITSTGSSFVTQWIDANTQVGVGWHAVGTGDFDGDTNDDILWRSDTGLLTYWFGTPANNLGFTHNDVSTVFVPTDWKVASVGDFNDDGRSDILWRQDAGQLTVWLGAANGTFVDNSANASTFVAADWSVVGTGDFNGDGYEDILWRQSGGQLTDWLGTAAGGFTQNSANFSQFVATDWHVVSLGDFNGDHRDDILWRNDNGQLTEWLGTATGGFTDNSANASTFVPTNWHVLDPLL